MEKQGMDRGKQLFRAGLLIFFILAFFIPSLFPGEELRADEAEALEVLIDMSPANPVVNSPWSVYVLVKHPSPREVSVEPPRFPSSLALERVRAEARTTAQGERWTRVEFLFTPLRVDTITLEPFDVKTPLGRALSAAVNVSIGEETVRRRYEPRFRWQGRAPSVSTGKKGELLLELVNWDPMKTIPQGFFQGKAPANAILEESMPLEEGGVYLYTISIIPLENSAVKIGPISFRYDIYALTIPEITVPVVSAGRSQVISGEGAAAPQNNEPLNDDPPPPFPSGREKVFFLFQEEYDEIKAKARSLWEENNRAEALAEIRKNERDNLFGPYMVQLRMEIEKVLGLGFTENERWRPFKIPLTVWAIFGFAIFLAGLFLFAFRPQRRIKWKSAVFHRGNNFFTIIALVFAAVLGFIFIEESVSRFSFGSSGSTGKTGVLKETQGYRIPDYKGAVSEKFPEGQPASIGDYRGDWYFAETPDGRSGWVPHESVIPY
jgi:hypothetical protein